MAHPLERQPGFQVADSQPVIAVPLEENGRPVVRYFADEAEADQALGDDVTTDALKLAGTWSDLDWNDVAEKLDRIRHDSRPIPPVNLDL